MYRLNIAGKSEIYFTLTHLITVFLDKKWIGDQHWKIQKHMQETQYMWFVPRVWCIIPKGTLPSKIYTRDFEKNCYNNEIVYNVFQRMEYNNQCASTKFSKLIWKGRKTAQNDVLSKLTTWQILFTETTYLACLKYFIQSLRLYLFRELCTFWTCLSTLKIWYVIFLPTREHF